MLASNEKATQSTLCMGDRPRAGTLCSAVIPMRLYPLIKNHAEEGMRYTVKEKVCHERPAWKRWKAEEAKHRGKVSQERVGEFLRTLKKRGVVSRFQKTRQWSARDRNGIDFLGHMSPAYGGFSFLIDVKSSQYGIESSRARYGDRGILLFAPWGDTHPTEETKRLFEEIQYLFGEHQYKITV
jgi:hypothetical protein